MSSSSPERNIPGITDSKSSKLRLTIAFVTAIALTLALTVVAVSSASAAPAGVPVPTTAAGAPQTIPGLATWTTASGTLNVTDSLKVDADSTSRVTADMLAKGLTAKLGRSVERDNTSSAGDVILIKDSGRASELGAEGYELTISDRIEVVGATDAGVFYGSQTVTQILAEGTQIPKGSSIDKPEYPERGVGICACQITVSTSWFERLMKDMSYLKLNQLWIETKVESDAYAKANFWGYYTKAQAKKLSDLAKKYHITLIPEVNSPGHMLPWLEDYPDLQLKDKNGAPDPDRLDITRPAAFTMITTLIDEYLDVFDTPYWHMGGDEYMLGSAYANFPQFQQYIDDNPTIFPAGSTPTDVVINFMNKTDDYVVNTKHKTLRIWNDSILTGTKLKLNSDIVVEHWTGPGNVVSPQALIDQGHNIENASDALYLIRRPAGDAINERSLWNNNWDVRDFGGHPNVADGAGSVTGAKITAWPDTATATTENQVESALFPANRFIAQATWGSPRPVTSYDDFATLSTAIGHAPNYQTTVKTPVPSGSFTVSTDGESVHSGSTAGSDVHTAATDPTKFTFKRTDDGYYSITSDDQLCLTMTGGELYLNAPLSQGLAASMAACNGSDNLQKWQIQKADGGFTIANAITLMPLVVNNTGTLLQQAPDVQSPAVFSFSGLMTGSITAAPTTSLGSQLNATLMIGNWLPADVTNVSASVLPPQGWGVDNDTISFGEVASGDEASKTVTFTPTTSSQPGENSIEAKIHYTDSFGKTQSLSIHTTVTVTCSASAVTPSSVVRVDSQESDYENTPGTDAIDGKSSTFWGTQWFKATPGFPHEITVDLGENSSICGVTYLPRQDSPNGQITDYEIYLNDDAASPASDAVPVKSGSFTLGYAAKAVEFDGAVSGRYLTLRALSENGPNATKTTSVAELSVDPAVEIPEAATPKLTASTQKGYPGSDLTLDLTGKPYWQYNLQFHSAPISLGSVRTDANGEATIEVTIPADATLGEHQFILLDNETDVANASFTVVAAPTSTSGPSDNGSSAGAPGTTHSSSYNAANGESSLASTGSDLWSAGLLALLFAALGSIMIAVRKRQRA